MRRILACVLAFTLTACAGAPVYNPEFIKPAAVDKNIAVAPGQSVVIVGYRVSDPAASEPGHLSQQAMNGAWVNIDPRTGMRAGTQLPWFRLARYIFADHPVIYTVHVVPPGTYALGYVELRINLQDVLFQPTRFEHIGKKTTSTSQGLILRFDYEFSSAARATPIAPTFTVAAGDVVYVGDILLDFTKQGRMEWALSRTDDDVKRELANTGLADRFVYRELRRASGAPIEANDGVAFAGVLR
jgi:hypothetical protein